MKDWFETNPDGATIRLPVTPNAKRDEIDSVAAIGDDALALRIRVTAPPEEGRANKAVIALLAKRTGLPRTAFTLLKGAASRTKTILIKAGPDGASDIGGRLESMMLDR